MPNDDLLISALINAELPGSMTFYYGKVGGIDSIDWGNLLLRRRDLSAKRLDRMSLGGIFTIGLPLEDAGRYYSS